MNQNIRYPRFFFAADTGGGTAVLEGPITAPAVSTATTIEKYVPPSSGSVIDDLLAPEGAPAPAKPSTPKEPAKPDAKSAAQKKPEPPTPPAKKVEDEGPKPIEFLRKRKDELEVRTRELETQLAAAKSDTRVNELTAKLAAVEKQQGQIAEQRDDLERKLLVHNPMVSSKLTALRDGFNKQYSDTMETVPALKPVYRQLLDQFAELPRGKDGYAEKLGEFRAGLREQFGDDAAEVFKAMQQGYKFRQDHETMAAEVHRDAVGHLHDEEKKSWESRTAQYDANYEKWFEPPPDAAQSDPLNVRLFLKNFEEGLPPEEVEKVNHNIKTFMRRDRYGAQPRRREDFPELDEPGFRAEMQRINSEIGIDREKAEPLQAQGMKLLMYFRPIVAKMQKLEEELSQYREASPPDPTRDNGSAEKRNGETPSAAEVASQLY